MAIIEEVLRVQHLNKNYYGNRVLNNININLFRGEILGIVGGNGAGKSTLAKILAGETHYDSGDIFICENELKITSVHVAQSNGIVCVFQEPELVEDMTVAENIYLIRKLGQPKFFNINKYNKIAAQALAGAEIDISPETAVKSLSYTDRRKIELVKATTFDTKIIILDEITSVMNADDKSWVRRQIQRLSRMGISFIVISHDLDEIMETCGRIVVMRDGHVVQILDGKTTYLSMLLERMRGEESERLHVKKPHNHGSEVLKLQGVATPHCKRVNFSMYAGEILGIYSITPNMSNDIAMVMYGLMKPLGGSIRMGDKVFEPLTPYAAAAYGIALIYGESPDLALMPDEPAYENISFAATKKTSVLGFRKRALEWILAEENAAAAGVEDKYLSSPVYQLSGGYKQKVLMAGNLARNSKIYIMIDVMAKVDFNARISLYNKISELRDEGKSIAFFSRDFEEIKIISDRILYEHEGTVSDEYFK